MKKKRNRNVMTVIAASAILAACLSIAIENHQSAKNAKLAANGQNL
jgi:hypothetical protein